MITRQTYRYHRHHLIPDINIDTQQPRYETAIIK